AMNAYLGWSGHWDDRLETNYVVFKKQSQIAPLKTAGLFVFTDVHPKSICWPYYGVQMKDDAFLLFPGSAHNRGAVISFVDSHVERHAWRDERTVEARSLNYHGHHDASPGNQDIAWLRRCTTVSR